MKSILTWIQSNMVLVIAGLLATISCFFVPPSCAYVDYINFHVLGILLALMLLVSELVRLGVFLRLTQTLCGKVHSARGLSILLILLAFLLSMVLTNDVTLVTLVPFTLLVLAGYEDLRLMSRTIILVTIAANLGSMLTPIGNPQNLYLYSHYQISLGAFLALMAPYSLVSLILLMLSGWFLCHTDHENSSFMDRAATTTKEDTVDTAGTIDTAATQGTKKSASSKKSTLKLLLCLILFLLALLTVARILDYRIMLGIVLVTMLLMDRYAFLGVDYNLLVTFVFFFILTGNLGKIPAVIAPIEVFLSQHVVLTAILSSQIISNVPAAMLLSTFTTDGTGLLVGTNLGGLGTIIASMASLISYRFYTGYKTSHHYKDHYMVSFTIANILFLAALWIFHILWT